MAEHRSTVTFEVSNVLSCCPSAATLVESVPGAKVVEELDGGRVSAILRLDSGAEALSHPVVVTVQQVDGDGWRSRWELTGATHKGCADLTVLTSRVPQRPAAKKCDFSIVVEVDDDRLAAPGSRRRLDIMLDRVGAQTARNLEALLVVAQRAAEDARREPPSLDDDRAELGERRTGASARRSALVGAGLLLALVGVRAWRRHRAGR